MTKRSTFCTFDSSPEIIRLAVMTDERFSLPLRNVDQGEAFARAIIDHSHDPETATVRRLV